MGDRRWQCNAYPDHVEVFAGQGVVLCHADCTELIPTGELGPAQHDGSTVMQAAFKAEGIVGIYRTDGIGHALDADGAVVR